VFSKGENLINLRTPAWKLIPTERGKGDALLLVLAARNSKVAREGGGGTRPGGYLPDEIVKQAWASICPQTGGRSEEMETK